MNHENRLIAAIGASREAYQKLSPYVEKDDLSDFSAEVYREIAHFYDTDQDVPRIDWELVKGNLVEAFPKRKGLIEEYVSSLPSSVSVPNLLSIYEKVKKEKIGYEIIQAVSGGKEEVARELMEQYLNFCVDERSEELFHAKTVEELDTHLSGHNLIPLYPLGLNEILGGVPRQSQICVFARPDAGKTTFAINAAVGAAQNNFRVLYIGNEDAPARMVFRILTRFCKTPEELIKVDTKKYYDLAIERGYANLYFLPMSPGTLGEITKWVEKLKPDMLVVDQVRNLNVKKESMTVNLEQACIGLRNIAKKHNLVSLLVTQAGDSAEGKLYLTMSDVDSSKTGLQGTLDLLIGLGLSQELKDMSPRRVMMCFPKNKLCAPISPRSATIDYTTNLVTA
jgi:KaiC/GvpD/RAD55 family RecA-like ATPase